MTFAKAQLLKVAGAAVSVWLLQSAAVHASEPVFRSLDGSVALRGGFGFKNITANELVYSGGQRLSQLIWTSKYMRVLSAELKVDLDSGWVFRANGGVGFGGNGHMEDYDWISPYATGTGNDDWSHQSIHPDTRLDRFFEAGVEVGRELAGNASGSVDLTGGFKYTNVKWTTWGGSYLYSSGGFRNTSGTIASTTRGITFEQRLPVVFAGLNGESVYGDWTFSSKLRGGFTVGAGDIDNHWLRNLRFEDKYRIAPVLEVEASAAYRFSNRISAFASAGFEKIFRAYGDITQTNTSTGSSQTYAGAAGGDYQSIGVSFGLKGQF
ncbi:omptin family outer membrane protease [Rhizobium sp. L1K21]|uniref:omptin family outer membrane protease n=1 Tax=Rhizobium sp. L1K21 TaxID=2954933 RepID=UPI00209401DB|nr:omptin family outer membrane protease [Rhizobium sp. L1K21]MCO6186485.1 omptin family outer membrane protease [Rhizobium sp. L1K21]